MHHMGEGSKANDNSTASERAVRLLQPQHSHRFPARRGHWLNQILDFFVEAMSLSFRGQPHVGPPHPNNFTEAMAKGKVNVDATTVCGDDFTNSVTCAPSRVTIPVVVAQERAEHNVPHEERAPLVEAGDQTPLTKPHRPGGEEVHVEDIVSLRSPHDAPNRHVEGVALSLICVGPGIEVHKHS